MPNLKEKQPTGVKPNQENLGIIRGMTFRARVKLFEDKAKTKALNLTGVTVELDIDGYLTLTEGAGLTVTKLQGEVVIELTAAQTQEAPPTASLHYFLIFKEGTEKVVPLRGQLEISTP